MRTLPAIAGAALICVLAQPATAARAGEYKWWRDPAVQQQLNLTADQVKRLEGVFAATQAEQRQLGKALERLDRGVQQAIAEAEFDETTLEPAVDELEAMRARRNATRTLMLVGMYRTLSPEQRQRLREMRIGDGRLSERRRRARRP